MSASVERAMGLGALADAIGPERVVGLPVGEVRGLGYDSRRVAPGTLFFAVRGDHVDGHDFVAEAAERGAIGAVVEREVAGVGMPQLIVDRARRALADAADAWFGRPSERLEVIGVTGTDGKTTSSWLAYHMLRGSGRRPGLVGTVFNGVGDALAPNDDRTTTPESPELQRLLARMVDAGDDSVVMEATSHGLALERTRNCRFRIGAVTTVTSEHLEFHGTLEAYHAAKALLVEEAPIAVLNADDPTFGFFLARARARVITYAIETHADLRARAIVPDAAGTAFRLESRHWTGDVLVPMPGRFNVHNALAAFAIAEALGLDLDRAAAALGEAPPLPGRMERIDLGQPFGVVVDYAHTADSLAKVLSVLRPVTRGRLVVVFGSAGERDPTKRPAMGRVAAELADTVVVTNEDPRLEDPRHVNEAIADGARAAGARDGDRLTVIDDRRAAIQHAVAAARPGDVLLLAGKGHERSIFIGAEKLPWDEASIAREALRAAGWGSDER